MGGDPSTLIPAPAARTRSCSGSRTPRSRCFVQAPLGHYADLAPALEIEGWSAYQADGTANIGNVINPLVVSGLYIPEAIVGNRFCHGDDQADSDRHEHSCTRCRRYAKRVCAKRGVHKKVAKAKL